MNVNQRHKEVCEHKETSQSQKKHLVYCLLKTMELMCHCSSFLLPPENPNTTCSLSLKYALVVLNQSLPRFAPLLWDHGISPCTHRTPFFLFTILIHALMYVYVVATAQVRVCADGGANRVYDEMPLFFPHQQPSHVRTRFLLLSLRLFLFFKKFFNLLLRL